MNKSVGVFVLLILSVSCCATKTALNIPKIEIQAEVYFDSNFCDFCDVQSGLQKKSQFGMGTVEPMEFVALQAINNMTETSANMPEDLQQALAQLRETTTQGFEACHEIQTTTMQMWQYKKCAALHLRMVTMTLTAIQREADARAALLAEADTAVNQV